MGMIPIEYHRSLIPKKKDENQIFS